VEIIPETKMLQSVYYFGVSPNKNEKGSLIFRPTQNWIAFEVFMTSAVKRVTAGFKPCCKRLPILQQTKA